MAQFMVLPFAYIIQVEAKLWAHILWPEVDYQSWYKKLLRKVTLS